MKLTVHVGANLGNPIQIYNRAAVYPLKVRRVQLRFKLFHLEESLTLSSVIPILENLGVQVIGSNPYRVLRSDDRRFWIQDFEQAYLKVTTMGCKVSSKKPI